MLRYQDKRLLNLGVRHGTTTRADGDMKDAAALAEFLKETGLPRERMLFLKQTHSVEIIEIHGESDFTACRDSAPKEADAWLLAVPDCGVAIHTADCVPLFLWDKNAGALGLAHCGWQGVAAGLPGKIAARMLAFGGVKRPVCAYIGPHIGACCFETGPDVSARFPESAAIRRNGGTFIDLSAEVRRQLRQAGLDDGDIADSGACTKCRADEFFSFRADGTPKRMLSFIFKETP